LIEEEEEEETIKFQTFQIDHTQHSHQYSLFLFFFPIIISSLAC